MSYFGIRFIPALTDGSGLDAQGNALNMLGGKMHNGCEVGLKQSDTATGLPSNSPWLDAVGDPLTLYWADWLELINLEDDFAMKWDKLGSEERCHLIKGLQYAQGSVDGMSVGQIAQLIRWIRNLTCGYGHLTPAILFGTTPALLSDGTPALLTEVH